MFSVRSRNGGYKTSRTGGEITSRSAAPLPQGFPLESTQEPAAERLHTESEPLFVIGFELVSKDDPPVRLDFGFDRPALLARVDEGIASIRHAIMWFGIAGGVSILLALGITVFAMRTTQRMEGYFQDIYRRASLTEMAAELVHDLRNPLMALRTNVKALLISPDQTREIAADLDRDILILNNKLSGFLKLTRSHDEGFVPTDVKALIHDTARLAKPILQQHGLGIDLHIAANLPEPPLQEAAIRDALLNVIINAGESGQTSGAVRITATGDNDDVLLGIGERTLRRKLNRT